MIARISDVARRDVSRETFDRLEAYVALLKAGSSEQNLIAPSTLANIWERHILDAAQLAAFEPRPSATWADIGSGAGLPGIVVALLIEGPVTLIEPRRLRAEFLHRAVEVLNLGDRVTVEPRNVQRLAGQFDVITARAVARLEKLLEICAHLSTTKTVWVLPKGRGARTELVEAQRSWQGRFHLEPSVTGEDSYIIVGSGVGKKR